ncbi:MAG: hypothetical protein IPM30_14895 [Burkholderiales bacterium]|nr:hypothetical protein [Burkholderiales bacterium]
MAIALPTTALGTGAAVTAMAQSIQGLYGMGEDVNKFIDRHITLPISLGRSAQVLRSVSTAAALRP